MKTAILIIVWIVAWGITAKFLKKVSVGGFVRHLSGIIVGFIAFSVLFSTLSPKKEADNNPPPAVEVESAKQKQQTVTFNFGIKKCRSEWNELIGDFTPLNNLGFDSTEGGIDLYRQISQLGTVIYIYEHTDTEKVTQLSVSKTSVSEQALSEWVLAVGAAVAVSNPKLSVPERGDVLRQLKLMGDDMNLGEGTRRTQVDNVRYAIVIKGTLWTFIANPISL